MSVCYEQDSMTSVLTLVPDVNSYLQHFSMIKTSPSKAAQTKLLTISCYPSRNPTFIMSMNHKRLISIIHRQPYPPYPNDQRLFNIQIIKRQTYQHEPISNHKALSVPKTTQSTPEYVSLIYTGSSRTATSTTLKGEREENDVLIK